MPIAHTIVAFGDKLLQVYSAAFLCLSASALALKIAEEAKETALPPSDLTLRRADLTPKSTHKNNS